MASGDEKAASQAGHMAAPTTLRRCSLKPLPTESRSLIAPPPSIFISHHCQPGVTVLSAVGKCRRNIWFEAEVL
jgi:hypothetical protein